MPSLELLDPTGQASEARPGATLSSACAVAAAQLIDCKKDNPTATALAAPHNLLRESSMYRGADATSSWASHLVDVVHKAACNHVAASWPLGGLEVRQQLLVAPTDDSNLHAHDRGQCIDGMSAP